VSVAAKPLEQQSANKKSNLLKDQNPLFLFFEFNRFSNISIAIRRWNILIESSPELSQKREYINGGADVLGLNQ